MASNSGWTTGLPSGTSRVSEGDDAIRSFKSHMEAWWEDEHYATDGSAGSAGVHKIGSARVFVGTTSQLSNPTGDNSGRLFHTTDTGGLYVANASTSSWTLLTNGIALGSNQSWTGTQQFSNAILSDVTINPPGGGWNISGITSGATTIAAAIGVAAGSDAQFSMRASGLTFSDPVLIGIQDDDPGSSPDVMATAQVASNGSVYVRLWNAGSSRRTLAAGTVARFLGFMSS